MVRVRPSDPYTLSRIECQVRDEPGHFEARWSTPFQANDAESCTITIEEDRTVHGPLAQIWIKLMLRPNHYINKYLDALREAAM